MRCVVVLLILAVFVTPLLAQQAFRQAPGGTVTTKMADAVRIVAANNDTPKTVAFISGCDIFGYHVLYDRIAGTTAVKLYIDLSSDGNRWVSWQTAAFDSIASGTIDVERVTKITNPPNHAVMARLRIDGQAVAGDTTDVTVWWNPSWLPVAINP